MSLGIPKKEDALEINCLKKNKMKKFEYDFIIQASTEQEADTKMEALKILASKLSAKELSKLAHIVEKEPKTLAMAKSALGL